MADLSPQDMAAKLLASGFERSSPSAAALTDPIADTPMVVALDQLRPYDHDPRVTRNPAYEDIKASIRERGLDASRGWRSCANCGPRRRTNGSSVCRVCSGLGRSAGRSWR